MKITSSIPVLRVSDYPRARRFWREALGFKVVEEAGEPASFGILRKDAACVFLNAQTGVDSAYDNWRAYFHTDDLDAVVARLRAAGHRFRGPVTTDHGMREVEVADPDGIVICFGQDAP